MNAPATETHNPHKLYLRVIAAVVIGVLVGHFFPEFGAKLKPLGDGFIKLIKMLIAPIIFCTVVLGIAGMQDVKKLGRVGFKALVYFEVVSTVALIIGLVIVNILQPGTGMNVDPAALDTKAISSFTEVAKSQGVVEFLLNVIPTTVVDAFAKGELLQILLFSVLFGFALSRMRERGRPLISVLEAFSQAFFGIVSAIMVVAPLGAFGAMAFTVGKYGIASLAPLAKLMAAYYFACILFVFLVLGAVARAFGLNIFKILKFIREELLLVLGTSSSETALPSLMTKLEKVGCGKSIVGLVVPAGYSFNLDGTSIYLTMAVVFVAQATNTPLDLGQQLSILGILLLTSKGAAGVTGSGFVTLAATLSAVPSVPVAGLALILGIDRFMSEARAIINLIGNTVATLVIAKWENEFDHLLGEEVLIGKRPSKALRRD